MGRRPVLLRPSTSARKAARGLSRGSVMRRMHAATSLSFLVRSACVSTVAKATDCRAATSVAPEEGRRGNASYARRYELWCTPQDSSSRGHSYARGIGLPSERHGLAGFPGGVAASVTHLPETSNVQIGAEPARIRVWKDQYLRSPQRKYSLLFRGKRRGENSSPR